MSYDITIASDERFSSHCSIAELRAFLDAMPHLTRNGDRSYVLGDGKRQWMEIDLESVSEDGDGLEEFGDSDTVNCLRLHIPFQFLGDHPERDYFPTAIEIADHIGWGAIDDQTDLPLEVPSERSDNQKPRPWWRFW